MSDFLSEMRERRMFLEQAADDDEVTLEDREIAKWLTSEYLRQVRPNADQMIHSRRETSVATTTAAHNHNASKTSPRNLERDRSQSNVSSQTTSKDKEHNSNNNNIQTKDNSKQHTTLLAALQSIEKNLITDKVLESLNTVDSWDFSSFEFGQLCGKSSLSVLMVKLLHSRNIISFSDTKTNNTNTSINNSPNKPNPNPNSPNNEINEIKEDYLNIPLKQLVNYMNKVDSNYKQNPYHNHVHACDVASSMSYFMRSRIFNDRVSNIDKFAVLIAASVHDVGHPGHNNIYEVNTESELAVRYNDKSVLENMHIALAWKLLQSSDSNILINFTRDERKRFRLILIESVLATDMSKHAIHSETLNLLVESDKQSANLIDSNEFDSLSWSLKFLPVALHTADLANPAKATVFYTEWVDRLMTEFFNQGDLERAQGLPISDLCDRHKVNVHAGQVGFINFVIRPWFEMFKELLNETDQGVLFLECMEKNFEYMQERDAASNLNKEEDNNKLGANTNDLDKKVAAEEENENNINDGREESLDQLEEIDMVKDAVNEENMGLNGLNLLEDVAMEELNINNTNNNISSNIKYNVNNNDTTVYLADNNEFVSTNSMRSNSPNESLFDESVNLKSESINRGVISDGTHMNHNASSTTPHSVNSDGIMTINTNVNNNSKQNVLPRPMKRMTSSPVSRFGIKNETKSEKYNKMTHQTSMVGSQNYGTKIAGNNSNNNISIVNNNNTDHISNIPNHFSNPTIDEKSESSIIDIGNNSVLSNCNSGNNSSNNNNNVNNNNRAVASFSLRSYSERDGKSPKLVDRRPHSQRYANSMNKNRSVQTRFGKSHSIVGWSMSQIKSKLYEKDAHYDALQRIQQFVRTEPVISENSETNGNQTDREMIVSSDFETDNENEIGKEKGNAMDTKEAYVVDNEKRVP